MPSRAVFLLICLLAWACDTSDPLAVELPPPPSVLGDPFNPKPSSPPPGDLRWYGDVLGLEVTSRIFARLSPDGQRAFLRMGNASYFTSSGVGYSGRDSPLAIAFGQVLAEPARGEAFLELLLVSRSPAQLYGLAGLQLVAPDAYRVIAPSFALRPDPVPTFIGCIVTETLFAELLDTGISTGAAPAVPGWPAALIMGSPGPNPGMQRTRVARR
ncbi:hypothetical protein GPROT1_03205 [Gammaproteobacteria bacterium]|nr:hypothetical protein GPROT1_03205 [Gammaproteobacteria bacterium]